MAGARRGVVRPRQRRPHAEPRSVGDLHRGGRARRDPAGRAYRPTDEERLIRELVLQLKRGALQPSYFRDDTAWTCSTGSREPLEPAAVRRPAHQSTADQVTLSRDGLLRVDALLPRFFLPEHVDIRYTYGPMRNPRVARLSRTLFVSSRPGRSRDQAERIPADAARPVLRDRRGRHRAFQLLLPLHGRGRARAVARGRAQHRAARVADIGWPRVAASFDYQQPLRFEDEFDDPSAHRRR